MLRLVSFNPLSLAKDRLSEVSEACGWAQLVALQGTQRRHEQPVVTEEAPRHKAYHFGYDRGALSNRSAGCAILHRQEFGEVCEECRASAATACRSRGAIRLQSRSPPVRDLTVIVGYYPPRPRAQGASQGGVCMRTVMALTAWIGAMLSAAPTRSTPLVCVDLNDGIGGRFTDAGAAQRVDSNLNGEVQFDVEHEAGLAFREMLDFHEMSVLTTHFRSGYTYYGAGGYVVPLVDRYCAAG